MDVSLKKLLTRVGAIAGAVAVLDQRSKSLIELNLRTGEIIPVVEGFFNITLVHNRGAAFGLFGSLPDPWRGIVLSVTSTIALIFVAFLLTKDFRHNTSAHVALGMIVGGGIGNAIDRIQHGAVVDFLDCFIGSYHWPAFNVADSAIFVGVVILLILGSKKPDPTSSPQPGAVP